MRLAELAGRRVALAGAGLDVRAALGALEAVGPASIIVVTDDPAGASDLDLEVVTAASGDPAIGAVEVFVRSPGFGRSHPVLTAADQRGASVTTPIDLWLGERPPERVVVGITGTKGKSSTTTYVDRLARHIGAPVSVAGNLGPPVFDPSWDHGGPAVLEVSSYQACDLQHVPDLGVLTSLAPDHLTWHGGWDRYVADKLRLFHNSGGWVERVLVPSAEVAALAALDAANLMAEPVEVPSGWSEQWPATPPHVLQNLALAASITEELSGVRPQTEALDTALVAGVGGRLEIVGVVGGCVFIDDPLASNPTASAAALRWLRSAPGVVVGGDSHGAPMTVVLVGGDDRGVEPDPLADEARRWPPGRLAAVALAVSGASLGAAMEVEIVERNVDVEEAVVAAAAHLGSKGGVVIFSPGAPTPGSATWADRSAAFRRGVQRL
ncbi:MAG TPA: Mur ligase family protein [Acidimicrobiales bacterium]